MEIWQLTQLVRDFPKARCRLTASSQIDSSRMLLQNKASLQPDKHVSTGALEQHVVWLFQLCFHEYAGKPVQPCGPVWRSPCCLFNRTPRLQMQRKCQGVLCVDSFTYLLPCRQWLAPVPARCTTACLWGPSMWLFGEAAGCLVIGIKRWEQFHFPGEMRKVGNVWKLVLSLT